MAKVNLKNFERDMQKILDEALDRGTMKSIGDELARRIKTRTQLGRGVNKTGGPSVPLAKLADSTTNSRRRKRENGDLSALTAPKKSNLTETGQMLESIRVTEVKDGQVTIAAAGTRSDGKRNDDVASYAEDGSNNRPKRKFLDLSGAELNALQRSVRDRIETVIKRLLTK